MSGDEKVRTIQSKELWLAEDMTLLCGVLYVYDHDGQGRSHLS